MRRWEFIGGKSAKFWAAGRDGTAVTSRYGRIGTDGQTAVKEFDSVAAAESYLLRVIAEKETKGYAETGTPAPAEENSLPQSPGAREIPTAAATLPDEDTFELPGSWLRVLHPRRGGVPLPVAEPDPGAVAEFWERVRAGDAFIREVAAAPDSDPQLAKEADAYLTGTPTPRGAALVAHVVAVTARADRGGFADAWVAMHGLTFAAQVVAELPAVYLDWQSNRPRPYGTSLRPWTSGQPLGWHWPWRAAALRVRALLAAAGDDEYRAAVSALAGHRTSAGQRLVASYLVPTETSWVDECCAAPPGDGTDHATARTLLFCSLGSAEQVAALGPRARFDRGQWSLDVLATTAEGVGTAIAPMLVGALDDDSGGADARKLVLGALSRLPADEAFRLMLDRAEQKYVQPALLAAMKRYPIRALRLLAGAADGTAKQSATARRLLADQVLAEPELTAAALPGLPGDARAVVASIAERHVRVEAAPPEALPPLLTAPPWTRRRAKATPIVVDDLVPTERPGLSWAPGEREAWAATEYAYVHERDRDWAEVARRYQDPRRLTGYEEIRLFVNGPEHFIRPLLAAGRRPRYTWRAETWMKPIVARYGLDALPAALDLGAANPSGPGTLLVPFSDLRVARLMADWLVRLKAGRVVALAWLRRHGLEAARLLVPDAVGPHGPARAGAEAALRVVAAAEGEAEVARVAHTYGAKAGAAVEALLATDPLDNVPARIPKPGAWADPALLPQVLLRDRTRALPDAAAGHILTMLAISRPGEVYPGLDVVCATCDPASLAEFGWAVFERWRMAGLPAKDGWALTGLGRIGDDETVRRLTPVIRAWPGEGGHKRAVAGLDVLAEIGTELALIHLYGISQRVKFKALKVRAQEKIQEVADGLGLTPERLADRLVPDFGLDADGSIVLDYGPRRFVVGFDERLKPYVSDENGRRRKDLPAPGARDDAELAPAARKRFADLKKDVRTVAADVIRRLEAAMVARRDWTAAEFAGLFVGHPLTWHVARRLVWATGDGTCFRVAEDRTLAGVEDDELTLAADARVRLPHPLELTGGALDAWAEVFADYEILQPFPQLGRPVFALTDEERAASRLTRFEDVTVPTGRLLGMERRGWVRGEPQDAGIAPWIARAAGPDRFVLLDLDPGIVVGLVDEYPEQRLNAVWLNTEPDEFWSSRPVSLRFGDLDAVAASEVLADLTELTG